MTGNNRPISPHPTKKSLTKGYIFFQLDFFRRRVPLPSFDLGGSKAEAEPL